MSSLAHGFIATGLEGGEKCWHLTTDAPPEGLRESDNESDSLYVVDTCRTGDVADLYPRIADFVESNREKGVRGVIDSWNDLYHLNIGQRRRLIHLSLDLFGVLRRCQAAVIVCFKSPLDACSVDMANYSLDLMVEMNNGDEFIVHRLRKTWD